MKVQTRKIIALSTMSAYIFMNIYCIVFGGQVPDTFSSTTAIIVGYYFGKSTALDKVDYK